jgi:energy-coupling factor transporter transmembrane protein EcfT
MTPTSAEPQVSDWVRYPAAVVVAFLALVATAVLYGILAEGIRLVIAPGPHTVLDTVAALCSEVSLGFSGVFLGSLCFRRPKRFFGSVLLLLLGIGFSFRFLYHTTVERGDSFPSGYFSLVAIGGAAAVAFIYWRQQPPKKQDM